MNSFTFLALNHGSKYTNIVFMRVLCPKNIKFEHTCLEKLLFLSSKSKPLSAFFSSSCKKKKERKLKQ